MPLANIRSSGGVVVVRNRREPMGKKKNRKEQNPANRDPLTNEPGSHPVGTGVGAAGGAAAGATVGAIGGPMGVAVGAAVGGLVGGLAGKTAAEAVNPSVEDAYWRENYQTRPYVKEGSPYETYRAAYAAGWEARGRYGELDWEGVEPRLREDWTRSRASSSLTWEEASPAARDAFSRLDPKEDYRVENR
jgi:hypothetical protein